MAIRHPGQNIYKVNSVILPKGRISQAEIWECLHYVDSQALFPVVSNNASIVLFTAIFEIGVVIVVSSPFYECFLLRRLYIQKVLCFKRFMLLKFFISQSFYVQVCYCYDPLFIRTIGPNDNSINSRNI